jgi:hypothetical protein
MCHTTAGRGHKSYKAYIALFVCMATKAVHLEVVSDLTTTAFLLAYRRFVSRRGLCAEVYSDNGTTFVGADAELRRLFQSASDLYKDVAATLAQDRTTWSFNNRMQVFTAVVNRVIVFRVVPRSSGL